MPVLKELADVLSQPVAVLFQKSLDEVTVPDLTPLYKKGDKYLP